MAGKRRRFAAEFKARMVQATLREDKTLAEARLGLDRYFAYYNHLRRHRSLGRRTPAGVYGLEALASVQKAIGAPARTGILRQAAGVPSPRMLLLLRSPSGLPLQQQPERYPWRRFHLVRGQKLSSAWGQAKHGMFPQSITGEAK